jgi:hypothetical protein
MMRTAIVPVSIVSALLGGGRRHAELTTEIPVPTDLEVDGSFERISSAVSIDGNATTIGFECHCDGQATAKIVAGPRTYAYIGFPNSIEQSESYN